MKQTLFSIIKLRFASAIVLIAVLATLFIISCTKADGLRNDQQHAAAHSSQVVDKWITLQLRLMRNATGIPNHGFSRHFAYAGVAAFESLAPGLTGTTKHWQEKWNGLAGLPTPLSANSYYYPANANAALASINRAMFPNAKAEDKAAIDSLENTLRNEFLQTQTQQLIETSEQFGKAVATAVFHWAEMDGHKNASAPYTVPTGTGLWKPTPPAFTAPVTPYWGNNRSIIFGSTTNTEAPAPIAYSTVNSSAFFQAVKHVYDVSQTLTADQKAASLFWRDIPGVSSPGHWLSILQQVMKVRETSLDKAALAYALTGVGINDALISCFKSKYQYNLIRPVTYIHETMGHNEWAPYIGTPAHPEYPSAHSSLSAAAAAVLTQLFGNVQNFTDHTYDYLGYAPRTYTSFAAIAEEAGLSRIYGGIHYTISVQAGTEQGYKIADNIFSSNPGNDQPPVWKTNQQK
jgi:membrane-associated phospholipid phosphatase